MVRIYFWANAAVYLLIGLACMLNPERLARAVGYYTMDNSGSSDFLVVYAGLELGLALFYLLLARDERFEETGLLFSLCLYGGLVAFRIPSLFLYNPVRWITHATAGLELLFLLGAIVLRARGPRRSPEGDA
jgi:hypothetical protein